MKTRASSFGTGKDGFTLLELMAASVVLVIALSIAFSAFSGVIRGWQRGMQVLDEIKYGEFAIDQVANALDSTLYFRNPRNSYAFILEKGSHGAYPADTISFVTVSPAFVAHDSPLRYGPHRLELFVDTDTDGSSGLFARVMPAVGNPDSKELKEKIEPRLVVRGVEGLEVSWYDNQNKTWSDEEWKRRDRLPSMLKVTVYVTPEDPSDDATVFTRVIEVPVAASARYGLRSPTTGRRRSAPQRRLPPSGPPPSR